MICPSLTCIVPEFLSADATATFLTQTLLSEASNRYCHDKKGGNITPVTLVLLIPVQHYD